MSNIQTMKILESNPNITPQQNDVLYGRNLGFVEHYGNLCFCQIIAHYLPQYAKASTKGEKYRIVRSVMEDISSSGGRFLKLEKASMKWYEDDLLSATSKVVHAFRDALRTYSPQRKNVNVIDELLDDSEKSSEVENISSDWEINEWALSLLLLKRQNNPKHSDIETDSIESLKTFTATRDEKMPKLETIPRLCMSKCDDKGGKVEHLSRTGIDGLNKATFESPRSNRVDGINTHAEAGNEGSHKQVTDIQSYPVQSSQHKVFEMELDSKQLYLESKILDADQTKKRTIDQASNAMAYTDELKRTMYEILEYRQQHFNFIDRKSSTFLRNNSLEASIKVEMKNTKSPSEILQEAYTVQRNSIF